MFFIRDCNDTIVGNPAGYRTIRGAIAQEKNPRTKAAQAIREAFDARNAWYEQSCAPLPLRRRNICSIRRQGDE